MSRDLGSPRQAQAGRAPSACEEPAAERHTLACRPAPRLLFSGAEPSAPPPRLPRVCADSATASFSLSPATGKQSPRATPVGPRWTSRLEARAQVQLWASEWAARSLCTMSAVEQPGERASCLTRDEVSMFPAADGILAPQGTAGDLAESPPAVWVEIRSEAPSAPWALGAAGWLPGRAG